MFVLLRKVQVNKIGSLCEKSRWIFWKIYESISVVGWCCAFVQTKIYETGRHEEYLANKRRKYIVVVIYMYEAYLYGEIVIIITWENGLLLKKRRPK